MASQTTAAASTAARASPGAARLDRSLILDKCSSFIDFQLWPLEPTIDASGWLRNFRADEIEHALHLLNSFMFYSDYLTRELFASGFQNISNIIRIPGQIFHEAQTSWVDFCGKVLVTYVTGEQPNPTDSGFTFARMARQALGIDQNRIVSPLEALTKLMLYPNLDVLFVDDFVGSGDQFVATWNRTYDVNGQFPYSFSQHASGRTGSRFFYCPAICTQKGYRRIQESCNNVVLSPGNVLPDQYSAIHPDSIVWPNQLRASGASFVERASLRAGIPDDLDNLGDWRGHHQLGLTLGFSHSVPDATLPLFYWEHNGWQPLLRRT